MKTFLGIVHKDEDSAYGVSFPDVPGCFSASDTIEGLLPNASEALDLWFEDSAPIVPREATAIVAEIGDELAAGAFLIAVPLLSRSGKAVRVNISLDASTLSAIDSAAASRKLTRSAFIAEAARNEIVGAH